LLSGAQDGDLFLWDVNVRRCGSLPVKPLRMLKGVHGTCGPRAAEFHPHSRSIFASVGLDSQVKIWDMRLPAGMPAATTDAHPGGAFSIAFSNLSSGIFATGGRDHMVRLWDTRNIKKGLRALHGHTGDVKHVAWAQRILIVWHLPPWMALF